MPTDKSKPKHSKKDRSLVEVSNDMGDHWVADIPTDGVSETERSLLDAGAIRDKDDKLQKLYNAAQMAEQRDPNQYRFRSERVIDEGEDLENSHDAEEDQSDSEHSEQPAEWKSE